MGDLARDLDENLRVDDQSLGNLLNNVIGSSSRGRVSFDPATGQVGLGPIAEGAFRAVDEGLGEVTGRNLQREQFARAEQRLREAEARRAEESERERRRREIDAIRASNAAGASRRPSQSGFNGRRGTFAPGVLDDDKDFLGL